MGKVGWAVGPFHDDRKILNLGFVAQQLKDQHVTTTNSAHMFDLERILECWCKYLAKCLDGPLNWHQFLTDEDEYRSRREWEQLATLYWENFEVEDKDRIAPYTMNAFLAYLAEEYQPIMAAFFIKVAGKSFMLKLNFWTKVDLKWVKIVCLNMLCCGFVL